MRKVENTGRQTTLEDLQNLQVDGLDVSIIISDELAIIKVNGYRFSIDSTFVLSE